RIKKQCKIYETSGWLGNSSEYGGNLIMNKYRTYLNGLKELRQLIDEDFEYARKQNSIIDRRLNELGKRGDIEATADEMAELLSQRAIVKDRALMLLPLRDFFKNGFDEAKERVERLESYRNI